MYNRQGATALYTLSPVQDIESDLVGYEHPGGGLLCVFMTGLQVQLAQTPAPVSSRQAWNVHCTSPIPRLLASYLNGTTDGLKTVRERVQHTVPQHLSSFVGPFPYALALKAVCAFLAVNSIRIPSGRISIRLSKWYRGRC